VSRTLKSDLVDIHLDMQLKSPGADCKSDCFSSEATTKLVLASQVVEQLLLAQ